jgi:biopolymer transport protein ExbD
MAIIVGQGGDDVMVEMNTTPLIDVMLVLLVMLIITLPIQTHAVKLDMPRGDTPPPPTPPEVVDIGVDFDGTITWKYANAGEEVVTLPTLATRLHEIGQMPVDSQQEIHLKPNRLAKYGYVAQVMAIAQRNGAKKMGIVGNEAFLQQ